jgi:hypothetical protein
MITSAAIKVKFGDNGYPAIFTDSSWDKIYDSMREVLGIERLGEFQFTEGYMTDTDKFLTKCEAKPHPEDNMTDEEAIKILNLAAMEVEWECPLDYFIAINHAIKCLEARGDRR